MSRDARKQELFEDIWQFPRQSIFPSVQVLIEETAPPIAKRCTSAHGPPEQTKNKTQLCFTQDPTFL